MMVVYACPLFTPPQADMEVMGKGDRLDLISKLAKRLELQRIKVRDCAISLLGWGTL
jgi:hypothetical protein